MCRDVGTHAIIALALDSYNSREEGTAKAEDSSLLAGGGSVKTDDGSQTKETRKNAEVEPADIPKKPSGAERKKLMKERKIAAGTWTEENPHKNAAQKRTQRKEDQTKKGDKKPQSESQTPPHSKWNQAGQRKHPDTTLDQAQGDLVQKTLVERLYAAPSGSGGAPQFHRTSFSAGVIWMTYANQQTVD
ncbi:unnamed protein product [Psylliodes chrysocephalus]|uniref:Uncharacterized protein n=1 Tax=Psylliodes chrysocephalus TaxID=3402493 RepID=A0A9P0CGR7_9CUCU|nr:unnamed protein product [Psylliodes chrysocephala]